MEIAVGMHQHQGGREYQQDAMSIKQFGSIGVLAILADGMGGYEGGEIASKLVSENFREFIIEGEDIGASLKRFLLKGNDAIREYKEKHPEVSNMGTTAIAFFITDKNCQWISVGDSPLYVIRNRQMISRINENHSVAGLLDLQVKRGEISPEEAQSSPQRHMLTSAVSGNAISQMDVSVPYMIKNDDIFILASDGIETISDERIMEIVLGHMPVITQENAQNACEALVAEVIAQGKRNQDNVTVMILAKMHNDEPQTKLYAPSAAESKKRLYAIGAGIGVLLVLVVLFLLFGMNDKSVSDDNRTVSDKAVEKNVTKTKQAVKASLPQAVKTKKVIKQKASGDQKGNEHKDDKGAKKDQNGSLNKKMDLEIKDMKSESQTQLKGKTDKNDN